MSLKDISRPQISASKIAKNIAKGRARWSNAILLGKANIKNQQNAATPQSQYRRHNQGNHSCIDCEKLSHNERGLQQHRQLKH